MPIEDVEIDANGKVIYSGRAEIACAYKGRRHHWDVYVLEGFEASTVTPEQPLKVRVEGEGEGEAYLTPPAVLGGRPPRNVRALLIGSGDCPYRHR